MVKYWYEELTGNFLGFLFGTWATGLLSHFFETRSIKNVWGLAAKKTVIAKETFTNLEWIISILIGFIVFVLYTKIIQKELEKVIVKYKKPFFRWLITSQYDIKLNTRFKPFVQKLTLFTANVHHDIKRKFQQYSNRSSHNRQVK